MSRVKEERSPRTLLDASRALKQALYDGHCSVFDREELVIDEAEAGAPSSRPNNPGTGFILKQVEEVLVDIRRDLDVPVKDDEGSASQPLMMRIRAHADEISNMLTGQTMMHPNDGSTTISQLILDLNRLRASVEDTHTVQCVIL
tara:strand:+ start:236 stop:670 length:435 start_codon:yes stop_codon:yes gene_type:complete